VILWFPEFQVISVIPDIIVRSFITQNLKKIIN
jgi:hypothetical protein